MFSNHRMTQVLWAGALGLFPLSALFPLPAEAAEKIPPKTVVLTFDDAVKSHRTFVAPLLSEYGFGASFFVTHLWMDDTENFMTWQDIAEIHEMGFEIGNHTWSHWGSSSPKAASRLEGELELVANALERFEVPKPTAFAWPGNGFGPESVAVLRKSGIRLARRGMQPEIPYGRVVAGPYYDPKTHHPLLIPTTADAYPKWTLEHFRSVVDRIPEGKIAMLQFHGVPDVAHPWVHTPPERFEEYMRYLKEGEFNVIGLGDVAAFIDWDNLPADPTLEVRFPDKPKSKLALPTEVAATRQKLGFWLENMVRYHGYEKNEIERVCRLDSEELAPAMETLKNESSIRKDPEKVLALPYPGGRHPRIGFLDGAIDPQRGTKVSVFPPWEDGGYVVLDMPEAIFSNLGLTYLAHTHIPTIWNETHTVIENVDWTVHDDGRLNFEQTLPNGIRFGSEVVPTKEGIDLELWLENGTAEKLTGLRTQICALLKGLRGFNAQTRDGMTLYETVATAKAEDTNRYLLVEFERCKRTWGNPPCPCIHSDPVLPDAAPGERVSVKGRLWFYEGDQIEKEIETRG